MDFEVLGKKEELIETITITHLAFYAGWPNAMNAIMLAKEIAGTH